MIIVGEQYVYECLDLELFDEKAAIDKSDKSEKVISILMLEIN